MRPEHQCADSTAEQLPEAQQDRLARILDDYLVAMELGSPISPEELLARHPNDADRLRGYLSGLRLFHAAAVSPSLMHQSALAGRELRPEQVVGDYQLLREIGRGGMGVVYEALQISLNRHVALKILPLAVTHDAKQIERFKNEAQAAAHVEHPNIVPVYAIGEQDGVHYYAMQMIAGHSLAEMIADFQAASPPSTVGTTAPEPLQITRGEREIASSATAPMQNLNRVESISMGTSGMVDRVRAIARLGIQAAEALHAAHEYGIVHRDVKPSNLLVDDHGKLWVTDFGLARCRERSGLTQTGDVLGTMRYMSPEQALGRSGLIDHRTDIYSLGVTLYELATEHHPAGNLSDAEMLIDGARFNHKPMRHWNRQIPIDFQTIVMKSIAEFPGERYSSAQELADDLNRFVEGRPILASPPSLLARGGKWVRRHRRVVFAAAAALLLAFVGQSYNALLLSQKNVETRRALADAQRNWQEAHDVLDRITQLGDQLAAIPGADGVRHRLLEDSLTHYEHFAARAAENPALATDLAITYSKLGSLSERLGKNTIALDKYVAARELWQQQLADDPSDVESVHKLALCDNNIGLLLKDLDRPDEALRSLRASRRALRELLTAEPNSVDIAADLATTHNNLGLVLRQQDNQVDAAEQFREAIAIQERLATESPESDVVLRGLAASYTNLAAIVDMAASDVAINAYQKAIKIQKRLVTNDRINRLYQGDLARTYNNLGYLLARKTDWHNAELCYLDAVRLQENLVKASWAAASYRRDLAISYNNLGMVQSRGRRFAAAESSFLRAIELQRQLLEAEPNDVNVLSNLGGVYNNLGLLHDQQNHFADAESAFQHAIEFQRSAFDRSQDAGKSRDLLNNHYANYTKCLRRQQKQQAADAVAQQRETLLVDHP